MAISVIQSIGHPQASTAATPESSRIARIKKCFRETKEKIAESWAYKNGAIIVNGSASLIYATNGQVFTRIIDAISRGTYATGEGWKQFMVFLTSLRVLKVCGIIPVMVSLHKIYHYFKDPDLSQHAKDCLLKVVIALGALCEGLATFFDGLRLWGVNQSTMNLAIAPLYAFGALFALLVICLAIQRYRQNKADREHLATHNNLQAIYGNDAYKLKENFALDQWTTPPDTASLQAQLSQDKNKEAIDRYLKNQQISELLTILGALLLASHAYLFLQTSHLTEAYIVGATGSAIGCTQMIYHNRSANKFRKALKP